MRWLALLAFMTGPANAWEAASEGAICILTHEGAEAAIRLTYDPTGPEYSITFTHADPWPEAPVFSMRFDGPRPIYISTDRHRLEAGRTALTVTDRGFGNVLDGLQYNLRAISISGTRSLVTDLTGAAPEVAAFRHCTETPSV